MLVILELVTMSFLPWLMSEQTFSPFCMISGSSVRSGHIPCSLPQILCPPPCIILLGPVGLYDKSAQCPKALLHSVTRTIASRMPCSHVLMPAMTFHFTHLFNRGPHFHPEKCPEIVEKHPEIVLAFFLQYGGIDFLGKFFYGWIDHSILALHYFSTSKCPINMQPMYYSFEVMCACGTIWNNCLP